MEITVNACGIEEGREFAVVTVNIDDEQGHVLKDVQIEPELDDDGEAVDIRSVDAEDHIRLIERDDCFVPYDPIKAEFSKNIVPFFYDFEIEDAAGNREWVMKEEVQEAVLEAINVAIKNAK